MEDISRRVGLLQLEGSLINELFRESYNIIRQGDKYKRVRVRVRAPLPCKFHEFGRAFSLHESYINELVLESSKTISSRSELYYCESFFRMALPSTCDWKKSKIMHERMQRMLTNKLSAIRSTVQRKPFLRERKNYLIKLFFAVFKDVY